ncbi:MAG: hypothetical protein KME28_04245 [Pelatocladus maniniholoensis HA4357-MV3]|uniref:Uncharacterized protein n=1 Tax=Pelatocladus maniniholoensis HA4357-MV3 TaxID=1117104 RepID=A0A9E3H500_9NOST|nr:hypothetical protein [Pelatocladus maniniholoensis HA4357-MV3]MBW4430953.1 hypothetical protein [Pelatocladus maniniholoensis HA4357-MV3]
MERSNFVQILNPCHKQELQANSRGSILRLQSNSVVFQSENLRSNSVERSSRAVLHHAHPLAA